MPIQPHDTTPSPSTPPAKWPYGPPATPPPGYFPPVAPPPAVPPPNRGRPKWPFVLAGVVLVLGAGAGAVFGFGVVGGGSTRTVDIQITDDVSGGCTLTSGATITLKDEHGTTLGSTQLADGSSDGSGGCLYDQTVSGVPDDATQYTETNDVLSGTVTISHDELAGNGWVFPVDTYSTG